MWGFLRGLFSEEDRWKELDQTLTHSFEKIKTERKLIFSWINHLRKKEMENAHQFEQLNFKLGEHEATINQLQAEMTLIKQFLLSQKQTSGTSQGQIKDMSRDVSETPKLIEKPQSDIKLAAQNLRGAELEVLQLLYHIDRPLGYEEIASRLSKSEKSIRNIVYELRKFGIDIKSKPIGAREKGFYLDKALKMELSGR